jgi:lysophospholipase
MLLAPYTDLPQYMLSYELEESSGVILNGMRSLTLNGTVESWPRCLACALSDRSFAYTSENRTAECAECFNTWCWDGVDNSTQPSGEYEPVVGTVPSFLTERNLSSGAAPASGSASSGVSNAASGAQRVVGGLGGVAVGLVGVMGTLAMLV